MLNIIQQLITEYPFSYFNMINKNEKYADIKKYIYEHTQNLIDTDEFKYNITTRIYWILNGLTDFPICPICGEHYGMMKNISIMKPYKQTCNKKTCRYTLTQQHIQESNLKKYGVNHVFQLKTMQEKSKNTMLKKYGVDHPLHSTKIKEKIKNTCIEKYGVDNYSKTHEHTLRMKKTKLEKYGNESFVNPEKGQQTKFEKYGDKTYNNVAKLKDTCIEKYGVDNYFKTNEFKIKIKQTKSNALLKN